MLVLQGAPFLGAVFAMGSIDSRGLERLALIMAGSLMMVAQVFLFNDWADEKVDREARHKAENVFTTFGITPGQMLLFSSSLGVAGLAVLALVSLEALALGIGVMAAGLAYSHPRIYAKGIPIASSLAHLVGQSLHFLIGYRIYSEIDNRGMAISLFFAIVFVAGHLNQEVRDAKSDSLTNIRTNAVVFGQNTAFFASHILFTGAFVYLAVIGAAGTIAKSMVILTVLYPFYAFLFWRTFAAGLTFESVTRLQSGYRVIFVLIGVGMTSLRVLELMNTGF